jgi:WD40 repeat protein
MVWDATKSPETHTFSIPIARPSSVVFSPDGKRLVYGIAGRLQDGKRMPGEVKVRDIQTGQELFSFTAHAYCVLKVIFSPDGKRVAAAGQGGKVIIWD